MIVPGIVYIITIIAFGIFGAFIAEIHKKIGWLTFPITGLFTVFFWSMKLEDEEGSYHSSPSLRETVPDSLIWSYCFKILLLIALVAIVIALYKFIFNRKTK